MADDELDNFFAEIEEIQAAPTENESIAIGPSIPPSIITDDEVPRALGSQPVSIVYSKAPELREEARTSHPVYTYDVPEFYQQQEDDDDPMSRYYFKEGKSTSKSSNINNLRTQATPAPPPPPLPIIPRSDKVYVRKAADEVWVDETLQEWPENDFRIFIGDLGKEVTSESLTRHFQHYKSFAKAKAVRGKDGKPKGFGFVSFLEPEDCIKAIKEENGKYLGSRYVDKIKAFF